VAGGGSSHYPTLELALAPTAANALIVSDVERVPYDAWHTSPQDSATDGRVVQLGEETLPQVLPLV
jgi:hypothetical protein